MLKPGPVDARASLVVCTTCRAKVRAPGDAPAGSVLADLLERQAAADPQAAGIAVERMACLFACSAPCAVHLRGPGKIGYVLGWFEPTAEAAAAILAYAAAHARTADGTVPFERWPDGVKGRFIVRIPPPGTVVAEG